MKKTIITTAALMSFAFGLNAQAERPTPPAPEELATQFIVEFDANEDNVLNQAELGAALKDMRQKQRAQVADRRGRGAGNDLNDDTERPGKKNKGKKRQGRRGDPEQKLSGLIEQFDTDSDEALNGEELVSALEWMQENRGPRGAKGKRGPGPRGPQAAEDCQE